MKKLFALAFLFINITNLNAMLPMDWERSITLASSETINTDLALHKLEDFAQKTNFTRFLGGQERFPSQVVDIVNADFNSYKSTTNISLSESQKLYVYMAAFIGHENILIRLMNERIIRI